MVERFWSLVALNIVLMSLWEAASNLWYATASKSAKSEQFNVAASDVTWSEISMHIDVHLDAETRRE